MIGDLKMREPGTGRARETAQAEETAGAKTGMNMAYLKK